MMAGGGIWRRIAMAGAVLGVIAAGAAPGAGEAADHVRKIRGTIAQGRFLPGTGLAQSGAFLKGTRLARSGDYRAHVLPRGDYRAGAIRRHSGEFKPGSRFARDRRALAGGLRMPVDGARLVSGFGRRRDPILGIMAMHDGIDLAAPAGTPVHAAADGVVTRAGWAGTYGNRVRIRHDASDSTIYAHLRDIAPGIRPGRLVRRGAIIGTVGTTGRSTGPHLHFEVLRNGVRIDPRRWHALRKAAAAPPRLR